MISLGSQCWEAAGFFHRMSAVLLHILSNKTSSSMVIGLGCCCCHNDHGISLVSHVWCHCSFFYGTNSIESSNTTARNSSCGMADSQRIQSIRNCFQACSGGIGKQQWKPESRIEASDRRQPISTRKCVN